IWILFDSRACANCCPEWFAPEYPILPLIENAPSLRRLSGKTLDVQGRKIVQLDCGNGHSLSVQFYLCSGIPTAMAKDFLAMIDPTGNPVPIVRQGMKSSDAFRWNSPVLFITRPGIRQCQANQLQLWLSHLPDGRVEFGLTHKPRPAGKSSPRPYDLQIGRKPPEKANADIVEVKTNEVAPKSEAKTNVEPEEPELDRQVRVSRNPVDGLSSECLWGNRCTMVFDSSDPAMIDTGHQNEWADIEVPDGSVKKFEDPRGPTGHKWTGYTLFVPLDRPAAGENAEQETEDRSALKPKLLEVPGEPSESEWRLHELTHLPYRHWCEHCVRSEDKVMQCQPVIPD
ncbi:unnamed protein product, partial [Symbiodinium sp. CCMP2456]